MNLISLSGTVHTPAGNPNAWARFAHHTAGKTPGAGTSATDGRGNQ